MGHLTSPPLDRDDILEPVVECLTPTVAARILEIRIAPAVQERVDRLAAKAGAGALTAAERAEYEGLVEDADLLGIFKALARRALAV